MVVSGYDETGLVYNTRVVHTIDNVLGLGGVHI